MEKQDEYVQRIQSVYPDLTVYDAQLSTSSSQFNDILFINDELVFRFPLHDREAQRLGLEVAVLKALHGKLSISIPDPQYVATEPAQAGQAFIGYPKLPGKPLKQRKLDMSHMMVDESGFRQMVAQMAAFANELHSIPPESLGVELPRKETCEDIQALYDAIEANLFSYMRPDAVEWVQRTFSEFLGNDENFNYQPVLRHGDLGGSNILYDAESQMVSGVLDFSSIAVGDPATDAASLASISEPFWSYLYMIDEADVQPLFGRAQFYKNTFALQEALAGAVDGDKKAMKRGLAPYVPTIEMNGIPNVNPRED